MPELKVLKDFGKRYGKSLSVVGKLHANQVAAAATQSRSLVKELICAGALGKNLELVQQLAKALDQMRAAVDEGDDGAYYPHLRSVNELTEQLSSEL